MRERDEREGERCERMYVSDLYICVFFFFKGQVLQEARKWPYALIVKIHKSEMSC